MVQDHQPAGDPTEQLLQRQGADRQDRAVRSGLQNHQGPIQLEGNGGLHPQGAPATLLANIQESTLLLLYSVEPTWHPIDHFLEYENIASTNRKQSCQPTSSCQQNSQLAYKKVNIPLKREADVPPLDQQALSPKEQLKALWQGSLTH